MKFFYFSGTRKPNFKDIKYFDYDQYWKSRGLKLRNKLRNREKIFIDWIKDNSRVADLACGNSPILLELKNKKKCEVTGFDISSLIVEVQNDNGVNAKTVNISATDFDLPEDYDYIILSEILEHLVYPEKLIEKVLDKSKFFMISVPNSAFYRFRLGLLFRGRFFTQWAFHPAEHLRFWSHSDFLSWLDAVGLKLVDCKVSDGLNLGPIRFSNIWKNLFGCQICYLTAKK